MSRSLVAARAGVVAPPTVSISGTVTIGGTLTATEGGSVTSRKWQRGATFGGGGSWSDIGGATGTTYTPVKADIGYSIRCATTGPGGTTNSNTLAYDYATVAAVLDVFDLRALTPGAIGTLTGSKAGLSLTQGTGAAQPTASATSFGGQPGLTFDGGDVLTGAAGSLLNTRTSLRFVCAAIDTASGLAFIAEYGPTGGNVAGGFTFAVNDGAGTIDVFVFQTTLCERTTPETLATAKYVSWGLDLTAAAAVKFIRINGTAGTLSLVNTQSTPNPLASNNLSIGARVGPVFGWTGVMGGSIFLMSGSAQDSDLADAEAYVANGAGL